MSPHLIVPGKQLYYPQKTSASHPVGLYSHRPIRRQRYGVSFDKSNLWLRFPIVIHLVELRIIIQ